MRLTADDLASILARKSYAVASAVGAGAVAPLPVPVAKSPEIKPARRAKAKSDGPSESHIQQQLIKWWAVECLNRDLPEKVLMGFPLQGRRTAANGARLKAEGMRAGTPDLFLAVPMGQFHGLWVEMKKPGGKLSDSQKEVLPMLDFQGYLTRACYSFKEAANLITDYLDGVVLERLP